MNPGDVPSISAWANGHKVRISMRPARLSDTRGSASTLAEPVNTKRPGRRSRSTAALMGRNTSGARWTSSRKARVGNASTKPFGSRRADAKVLRSSIVR